MLLCTDVGNTNIKFALYVNEKQIVKLRFATDPKKTDDELAVELYTIFNINNIDIKTIDGSIILLRCAWPLRSFIPVPRLLSDSEPLQQFFILTRRNATAAARFAPESEFLSTL